MNVELPDGTIIQDVPDNITRSQLAMRLSRNGMKVPAEWMRPADQIPGQDGGPMPAQPQAVASKTDDGGILATGRGIVDAAGTLARNVVGGAVGGLGGAIYGAADSFRTGEPMMQRAGAEAAAGAARMTAPPATDEGQRVSDAAGKLFDESKLQGLPPTQIVGTLGRAATPVKTASGAAQTVADSPIAQTVAKAVGLTPEAAAARQAAKLDTVAAARAHAELVGEARKDGYVLSPRQARPDSTTANLVEGASGSAKMEKLASTKNQQNTNRLIAPDLDLKPGQRITPDAIEAFRKREGAAYQAVKDSGVTLEATPKYEKAVAGLGGDFMEALPGTVKNEAIDELIKSLNVQKMTPTEAIETVKALRAQATKNIKAGYLSPEKEALGYAQRKGANAIDDLIESSLKDANQGALAARYKDSRMKIARSHDIEAALNETTGNVDALDLARLLDKGRPLSGGTEKVARFAKAFSGSARNVDTMKDAANFSLADVALGGAAHLSTGNAAGLAAVVARPLVRSAMLSKVGQRAFGPSGLRPTALVSRADGGPIVPNQSALVGERGPEIVVPSVGGALENGEKTSYDPQERIPHYPQQRYLDKNLSPARTLSKADLTELARARKQAEASGVLTPELGAHLLPMAMVEGRSGNFGILQNASFYAKPSTVDKFKKMGITIEDLGNRPMDTPTKAAMIISKDERGDRQLQLSGNYEGSPSLYSKVMAAILSEKASVDKTKTVDGAIKRYNGKGRATEVADGISMQADVNTYLSKVLEAKRLLDHPKNAAIVNHFMSEYDPPQARQRGGGVSTGKPYLVGENGPEIIVPREAGTVIPNHAIGIYPTSALTP